MTVIAVLVLLVLTGCVWRPEIVHADPTLTSNDLVTGKVAVMPVKFDNDKAMPGERAKLAAAFLRAMRQNRGDIPVMTNPEHTRALQGALDEEAAMLRVYDYDEKSPDPNLLAPYRESLGARYLILSRLHYDQQAAGSGSRMANNTVESTLSGQISILDTTSGRAVWVGKFTSTRGGVDSVIDPRPSIHGLPFFSTFVKAWPAEP